MNVFHVLHRFHQNPNISHLSHLFTSISHLSQSLHSSTVPWLSIGCIVEAVCVLIKTQDNVICSSWHGSRNVSLMYTKDNGTQYEFFHYISLHSHLGANECEFALMAPHFLPTVQNPAPLVNWELSIVPRCESESEYGVCLFSSTCWDASSIARQLGLVGVNRR